MQAGLAKIFILPQPRNYFLASTADEWPVDIHYLT